ncbi:MAG: hypothetical protein ACHRXM_00795 [Isosphaerales bacterium]
MTELWPRRVAILFCGGDSPGINALLGNLVRLGLNRHRAEVWMQCWRRSRVSERVALAVADHPVDVCSGNRGGVA